MILCPVAEWFTVLKEGTIQLIDEWLNSPANGFNQFSAKWTGQEKTEMGQLKKEGFK